MKHSARLFLFRTVILILVFCLSAPAVFGESDEETYYFCIREEDGTIVAAMDRSYYIQSNIKWLNMDDNPPDDAYAQAIATMKRDLELSRIGKLSFIPEPYLQEYTGGKQGVFVQMGIGFPVFAVSGEDHAVIVIDEFGRNNTDIGLAMTQLYSWLGSALVLAENLGTDVRVYQIESVEDDGYTFEFPEILAYETLYAYLGGTSAWLGNIGMEANLETYVRWFLAQSTIRRLILADDPGVDTSVFSAYMPDGDSVLVVIDADAEKNYVIIKSKEETFILSIMGALSADPLSEEMIINGYVQAVFRLNGYQPGDYMMNSLVISEGSLMLMNGTSDADRADRMIDAWIGFAVANEQYILQYSGQ